MSSTFERLKLEALQSNEWKQVLFDLDRVLREPPDPTDESSRKKAFSLILQSPSFANFTTYFQRAAKGHIYLDPNPQDGGPAERMADCLTRVLSSFPSSASPNSSLESLRLLVPLLNRNISHFSRYPKLRASLWFCGITASPESRLLYQQIQHLVEVSCLEAVQAKVNSDLAIRCGRYLTYCFPSHVHCSSILASVILTVNSILSITPAPDEPQPAFPIPTLAQTHKLSLAAIMGLSRADHEETLLMALGTPLLAVFEHEQVDIDILKIAELIIVLLKQDLPVEMVPPSYSPELDSEIRPMATHLKKADPQLYTYFETVMRQTPIMQMRPVSYALMQSFLPPPQQLGQGYVQMAAQTGANPVPPHLQGHYGRWSALPREGEHETYASMEAFLSDAFSGLTERMGLGLYRPETLLYVWDQAFLGATFRMALPAFAVATLGVVRESLLHCQSGPEIVHCIRMNARRMMPDHLASYVEGWFMEPLRERIAASTPAIFQPSVNAQAMRLQEALTLLGVPQKIIYPPADHLVYRGVVYPFVIPPIHERLDGLSDTAERILDANPALLDVSLREKGLESQPLDPTNINASGQPGALLLCLIDHLRRKFPMLHDNTGIPVLKVNVRNPSIGGGPSTAQDEETSKIRLYLQLPPGEDPSLVIAKALQREGMLQATTDKTRDYLRGLLTQFSQNPQVQTAFIARQIPPGAGGPFWEISPRTDRPQSNRGPVVPQLAQPAEGAGPGPTQAPASTRSALEAMNEFAAPQTPNGHPRTPGHPATPGDRGTPSHPSPHPPPDHMSPIPSGQSPLPSEAPPAPAPLSPPPGMPDQIEKGETLFRALLARMVDSVIYLAYGTPQERLEIFKKLDEQDVKYGLRKKNEPSLYAQLIPTAKENK